MPELPEVETIRNELAPHVVGKKITAITLHWEGIVKHPSAGEFCSRLMGRTITSLSRRGKYLLFRLDNDEFLIAHMKMTGSLLLKPRPGDPERYIRAVIHLEGGAEIYFRDPRKFGVLRLAREVATLTDKLGPEPLETDFTVQVLSQRLARRKAPIKAVLLDQEFIAGIGNMYADEALFAAGIHPLRPAGNLSLEETERLHEAIQRVLRAGIGNKGASTDTYFRPDGEKGTAHDHFQVAHRRGENCPRCGTPLERLAIRNRGSYFCPHCQPQQP